MNDPKDTKKATGISMTLRLGLAAFLAGVVTFIVILVYVTKISIHFNPSMLSYVFIPTFTYIVGIIINTVLQNNACGKIDIVRVATSNLFNFVVPLVTIGLVNFIPFLKSPIESIFPFSFDFTLKSQLAVAFWLFWAILYSQVFASGFISIC